MVEKMEIKNLKNESFYTFTKFINYKSKRSLAFL